jgi:hypothetical protein
MLEIQKRKKNGALIMGMILLSRGRKKSEKWNFIGRFGRERKAAVFGTMNSLPEMAK